MEQYMMYSLFFITGVNLGVLVMFIWTTKRTTELKQDITDLRVMRNLLKEELIKKQTKRTPRKYRGKKIGRWRE
tara:strand:- start:306 stop:527 length:222 start_codon:yes stop_codon:yes gene_type:complete